MISLERPLRLVKDGRVGEAGENVERSSIADGRGRRDGGMDGKKGALEGVAIPRINNSCERRETSGFSGVGGRSSSREGRWAVLWRVWVTLPQAEKLWWVRGVVIPSSF
jgi:hypothetical protein